ncbi:Gam-like protein [Leptospira interrogans serovar Bataviae str. HAI135]|nr:Gam-like protein [Leptospira interrogans serovar Bataviae str. HAI135]
MSSIQPLKTLEDLNKRLQRLIEIESDLKRIDGDKNAEVESIRSKFTDTERELVFEKENLDKQVREYILNNKDLIFVNKKPLSYLLPRSKESIRRK